MRNLSQRAHTADAEVCESAELNHPDPAIEARLRRLCRIGYVELMHWQALARLADERTRLEADLAALERS
jgi:hypothetical protein